MKTGCRTAATKITRLHRFFRTLNFFPIIAENRKTIEKELHASQAPAHSLTELLNSLNHLITYRPEYAIAYLPFWYFAWSTDLLALLRSEPHLSFMVVTDDVKRFVTFAGRFQHCAKHFLMATSSIPTVKVEPIIIPIPPDWLVPINFPFVFMKKSASDVESPEVELEDKEVPYKIQFERPATLLPPYIPIDTKDEKGEDEIMPMMALYEPYLPQEAIDLMVYHPIKDLIGKQMIWFSSYRHESSDSFLYDLILGYERGIFPVYFDKLPTSNAVTICSTVQISVPREFLDGNYPLVTAKWTQALQKIIKLPKDKAQIALLDLPNVFSDIKNSENESISIEISLFEFIEIDRRVFYPTILIREQVLHSANL